MKYGNLTLGQIEAGINKLGIALSIPGEEAFMRLLRDQLVISEAAAKKLLERLPATIAVPAMTQFIAADNFVVDTSARAKVKISGLGDNLKKHFLKKIESYEVAAENLAVNKLLEFAYDPAIITALGGEPKVEITLGQFFAVFAKQPNGEAGTLLTNGYANVGYIPDINGVLGAVYGYWCVGGWFFEAGPFVHRYRWIDGLQFLSR
ncbi:MAG: hypothetical protein WAN50_02390 [Minisyncoccia bacterium]